MCTNCSGERSFSRLKLIKNALRSNLTQEHLNDLAILSIESEIVKTINYETIIEDFSFQKARKMPIILNKQNYNNDDI